MTALALTDHEAETREALQRYLALPSTGALKNRGMEGAPDIHWRRSTRRRDERPDERGPAQGGDAGGMSETRKLRTRFRPSCCCREGPESVNRRGNGPPDRRA